jgi:LmbE family N-acetylglucosaminyl deacetylase
MKLKNPGAEIFIPDNTPVEAAFERTTHMAFSAHQDDIEIMAYDGILKCFGKEDAWFSAVVATNGAGSPRDDLYANFSDEEMQKVRKIEQKKAAYVGEYSSLALLNYPSSDIKDPNGRAVVEEFKALITAAKPQIIYTHNLADKHDTHIAVVVKLITALRELPTEHQPEKLYGCEVWRNLDWVNDDEKVYFDVSAHPNLAAAVLEVFDSQICGGKRYDLATTGRRLANATYAASHGVDTAQALSYGMDLTPLIKDKELDIKEFIKTYIDRFAADVAARIGKVL